MKNWYYSFVLVSALTLHASLPAFSQWSTGSLARFRFNITSASVGTKALFAGGYYYRTPYRIVNYAGVDIYDDATGQWTAASLSQGRIRMAVTNTDTLAFFGGGMIYDSTFALANPTNTARIDIYNVNTNQWKTAELSRPRENMAAASAGGKVLFAGGTDFSGNKYRTVDIYDVATNQWWTTDLPRLSGAGIAVTSVGSKIYFAANNQLDVFDTSTSQWQIETYPEPTTYMKGLSLGERAFFAGGVHAIGAGGNASENINILNITTDQWSVAKLSVGRFVSGVQVANILLFGGAGSSLVDIYDETLNQWSTFRTPNVSDPVAMARAGNKVLFASNSSSAVDILTVTPTTICQSRQSGSWGDSTTWACGYVPGASDYVILNSGHAVSLPSGETSVKKISNNGGRLIFSTESSKLRIGFY